MCKGRSIIPCEKAHTIKEGNEMATVSKLADKILQKITSGEWRADMPAFLLLGQDPTAAEHVESWALKASEVYPSQLPPDGEKIQDALKCAQDMAGWEPKKIPD